MKNLLVAMFAVSLLAGFSAAQPQRGRDARPGMGRAGGGDGLSPELREKIEAARKAERKAVKPLQRDLRDAITKLSDLLEDEASDKALQAGMDRVEKAQKALRDQREKSRARMQALLPLRQRAMMMVRMGQGMGGRRGMMRQGMGGPGMRGGMGGPGMRGGMGGPGMRGDDERGGPDVWPGEDEGPDDDEP